MLDNVKERAASMGSRANTVVENVTQAVATAAGVVVGSVQAVMPHSDEGNDRGRPGEADRDDAEGSDMPDMVDASDDADDSDDDDMDLDAPRGTSGM